MQSAEVGDIAVLPGCRGPLHACVHYAGCVQSTDVGDMAVRNLRIIVLLHLLWTLWAFSFTYVQGSLTAAKLFVETIIAPAAALVLDDADAAALADRVTQVRHCQIPARIGAVSGLAGSRRQLVRVPAPFLCRRRQSWGLPTHYASGRSCSWDFFLMMAYCTG